jgi:hypothetical protein
VLFSFVGGLDMASDRRDSTDHPFANGVGWNWHDAQVRLHGADADRVGRWVGLCICIYTAQFRFFLNS